MRSKPLPLDIYCFGDSITRGEYDAIGGGWAERLKAAYMRRYLKERSGERCVFNLGITGETTAGLKRRFASELKARHEPAIHSVVTFAYGANDAAQVRGVFNVEPARYAKNLSDCIDQARDKGCETLLLNTTPVTSAADGRTNQNGRLRRNSFIERYNEALSALAAKRKVPLIDVHTLFMKHDLRTLFSADGVHPNSAGHALIFRAVKEHL